MKKKKSWYKSLLNPTDTNNTAWVNIEPNEQINPIKILLEQKSGKVNETIHD